MWKGFLMVLNWKWSAYGVGLYGQKHMQQGWSLTSSNGQGCMWSLAWELGKISEDSKKIYQDLFIHRTSLKIGKKQINEESMESVKDSQGSLAKALVTSRNSPLPCPPPNRGQTTIELSFDRGKTSDICRNNDAQLEMAIANFFHCENIADRVVESIWFKYMLKQAWLVGSEFRAPTRKNWR